MHYIAVGVLCGPVCSLITFKIFPHDALRKQRLTQGVERGDVLQHVVGLLGTGLPHETVHVVPEADARHL